ncbi:hypothetical protein [Natribacillus halophilus]|uniref:Uncharacterized protein n=1 Tax=Natribacillus halophilus TaxID=549003 RepID=A0A1G8QTQ5_9BACI|nr:hypothetical protein [Natribacillus halophilus]SDJ08003.1 hypothetical protein SAMN04488123_1142 [Natribacillus halophilus]
MFGVALKEKEAEEMIYLLKREMDEVLADLYDDSVEGCVKQAIEEKYTILFNVYRRMVPSEESVKYDLYLLKKNNSKPLA